MSGFSDDALLMEFVTESREHLSTIEPDLLVLEKKVIKRIRKSLTAFFVPFTALKGHRAFLGLNRSRA